MTDFATRKPIYANIERERSSRVLAYVTGDRPGLETQISPEVVDLFVDHLDVIWPTERISLVLHTNGGDTAAAWRLINLLRAYCNDLEIIVPSKAMSAGTLMCLGANRVIMTKQAALGPIDPSLSGPLNPEISGFPGQRAPVSVEAVQGYLDVARNELKVTDAASLAQIWMDLSKTIHPLVLGQIFRSRQQIRDLASKLLKNQGAEDEAAGKIISFLCSESGSHDHAINRREAAELGLSVEKPSAEFYPILMGLQASIVAELELRNPFNPDTVLGTNPTVDYIVPRALIESPEHGSHQFISEGTLTRLSVAGPTGVPQVGFQDMRRFEGWRKVAQP